MRLTYKRGKGILVENNIEYGTLTNVCYQDCVDKLGQLEDIEQELGIDFITLIKAISNGIWVKTKNDISKHLTVALKKRHHTKEYWLFYRPYSHVYLEDYGKTWALTKEELEK